MVALKPVKIIPRAVEIVEKTTVKTSQARRFDILVNTPKTGWKYQ